jgi:hypothetical protein
MNFGIFFNGKRVDRVHGAVDRAARSCHTPVLRNRTEASIRVPRMFKSHTWQQYDKQMKCYK